MIDLNRVIKVDGVNFEDRQRAIDERYDSLMKKANIGIVISLSVFFGGIAMIIFGG